jgi:hypothetical protein
MRNITKWKQTDFSKGIDHSVPNSLVSPNSVLRMLNLLPNENGKPAELRPGFQDWQLSNLEFVDKPIIGIERATLYSVSVTDTDAPNISSGMIVAYRSTTGVTFSYVLGSEGMVLAAPEYVKNAASWTVDGTVVTEPGEETWVPPTSETVSIPATSLVGRTVVPIPGTAISGIDDVWSDEENSEGKIGSESIGNNDSNWEGYEGETGYLETPWSVFADPDLTSDGVFWSALWDSVSGDRMVGDYWYETSKTPVSVSSERIRLSVPYYFDTLDISYSQYDNPVMSEPHIDWTMTNMKNKKVDFLFSYDGEFFGASVYVYYRNSALINKVWLPVTVKSTTLTPLVMADQSVIASAPDRWTVENDGSISCSIICQVSNPEFRVIFTPSPEFASKEDAGGYFNGIRVT